MGLIFALIDGVSCKADENIRVQEVAMILILDILIYCERGRFCPKPKVIH